MEIVNFWKETLDTLSYHGKDWDRDVRFISISLGYQYSQIDEYYQISKENFKEIAEKYDYNSGFGAVNVPASIKIVGDDFWIERHEYDGSEWWEYKTLPKMPKKTVKADKFEDGHVLIKETSPEMTDSEFNSAMASKVSHNGDDIDLKEKSVELLIYAESLFEAIITNDWFEGDCEAADRDLKSHLDSLRKVISIIKKYDPSLPMNWMTAPYEITLLYPDGLTEKTFEKAWNERYWMYKFNGEEISFKSPYA